MKTQYQKYHKMQFCIQLYIDIWEIFLYLQDYLYRLKTKNINSLVCINTIINVGFSWERKKEPLVY